MLREKLLKINILLFKLNYYFRNERGFLTKIKEILNR